MRSVINIGRAVILAGLFGVSAVTVALDSESIEDTLASEFAECSAYYGVLSQGIEEGNEAKQKMQDVSVQSMLYAVEFSNKEVSFARAKLDADRIRQEMHGKYSNGAIIIEKYGKSCKLLLEFPELRIDELMNK